MTVLRKELRRIGRHYSLFGICQWGTTDTSGEVPCDKISEILAVHLTPIGAAQANDQLCVVETPGDSGIIARPTAGTITVDRVANTGSDSYFSFEIIGR